MNRHGILSREEETEATGPLEEGTAITIDEWMNENESKCDGCRRAHRIHTACKRPSIVVNDAADEVANILGPGANVVGNRFLVSLS